MKNKLQTVVLLMLIVFLFNEQKLFASDDGSLQLNTQIITESDGGLSISNEFPIRNALFGSEMNRIVEAQISEQQVIQQKGLDFSAIGSDTLYQLDTNKVTKTIFINYQPAVRSAQSDNLGDQVSIWYWLNGILALVVLAGGITLGRRQAKRKVRNE